MDETYFEKPNTIKRQVIFYPLFFCNGFRNQVYGQHLSNEVALHGQQYGKMALITTWQCSIRSPSLILQGFHSHTYVSPTSQWCKDTPTNQAGSHAWFQCSLFWETTCFQRPLVLETPPQMLKTQSVPTENSLSTKIGWFVSWCFKASQPQRITITSGLRETFVKVYIYIVERTNKAELRPKEQTEKAKELSGEFMEWNRVERTIKTETDTRTE